MSQGCEGLFGNGMVHGGQKTLVLSMKCPFYW